MRYLKMTLPALILVVVLIVALVIYPDMAKSYQEKQNAAAQAESAENSESTDASEESAVSAESTDASVQSSEIDESSAASVQHSEESTDEEEGITEESGSTVESSAVKENPAEEAQGGEDSAAESAPKNTAPDFKIRDAFGIDGKLSDHFGKPIVVNFWATWCPFCVQELPIFDKYAKEYAGDIDFMIVDLADGYRETIELAKKYVDEYGYSFPVYYDTTGGSTRAYGITGIPVTLFIDSDGNLMTQHVGAIDEDALLRNIQALEEDSKQ